MNAGFRMAPVGAKAKMTITPMGVGEVSGVAAPPDVVTGQFFESTMSGRWRVRFTATDEKIISDCLEIATIPEVVKRAACGETNGTAAIRSRLGLVPSAWRGIFDGRFAAQFSLSTA